MASTGSKKKYFFLQRVLSQAGRLYLAPSTLSIRALPPLNNARALGPLTIHAIALISKEFSMAASVVMPSYR